MLTINLQRCRWVLDLTSNRRNPGLRVIELSRGGIEFIGTKFHTLIERHRLLQHIRIIRRGNRLLLRRGVAVFVGGGHLDGIVTIINRYINTKVMLCIKCCYGVANINCLGVSTNRPCNLDGRFRGLIRAIVEFQISKGWRHQPNFGVKMFKQLGMRLIGI
ncbi:hypothetical protein B40_0465 [Lactococcus cremoris]|nr:hypothetical protein B40_0465 [Lactococcus cremoris]